MIPDEVEIFPKRHEWWHPKSQIKSCCPLTRRSVGWMIVTPRACINDSSWCHESLGILMQQLKRPKLMLGLQIFYAEDQHIRGESVPAKKFGCAVLIQPDSLYWYDCDRKAIMADLEKPKNQDIRVQSLPGGVSWSGQTPNVGRWTVSVYDLYYSPVRWWL